VTQTVNTIPVELGELRAASTAAGGTVLSSTTTGAGDPKTALGITPIPIGADYVSITPRALAGAAVAQIQLNPRLTVVYTLNNGLLVTDISDELQDGDTTDIAIDSLPTLANGGAIYVGARVPFRGVAIEQGSTPNATANDLTVDYWGDSWTDITDTDSTDTGASLAVDGTVTWTVPTAWKASSLKAIGDYLTTGTEYNMPSTTPHLNDNLYWTRWEWSAAMNANTDIEAFYALNRSSVYAELVDGQTAEFRINTAEIANIQGSVNAGSGYLVVNAGTLVGSEFV
jgi:hypothetical protein